MPWTGGSIRSQLPDPRNMGVPALYTCTLETTVCGVELGQMDHPRVSIRIKSFVTFGHFVDPWTSPYLAVSVGTLSFAP